MNLIDLYTREVGRNLPEKIRADIEKEIRSLIEDNLEDESAKTGRAVDEDMQAAVLKRLGPPERVAASYLPPRYLIGPELYPHFITTLRIVLGVVAVLAALGIGASLGAAPNTPQDVADVITRLVSGLLDALFSAAGTVVLVFAIIQLASPNFKPQAKDVDWDPRKLASEPDPERVSIGSAIAEIVTTALALVIFNLYPHWVGIFSMGEQGMVYASILSEAFLRYLPWLSALWILEIAFSLWLVARGKWSNTQRWVKAGLTALSIGILAWMLSGPALAILRAEDVVRLGWDLAPNAVERVNDGLQTSIRVTLGIIMALQLVELVRLLYKLLRQRLPEALIASK